MNSCDYVYFLFEIRHIKNHTHMQMLQIDRMNRLVLQPPIDPSHMNSTYMKFDPELSTSYKDQDIEVQVKLILINIFSYY